MTTRLLDAIKTRNYQFASWLFNFTIGYNLLERMAFISFALMQTLALVGFGVVDSLGAIGLIYFSITESCESFEK